MYQKAIFIVLLMFLSTFTEAQKVISLEEALQTAKSQNLLLQSKKTEVLYQENLQKTAFNLPKMVLDGQYGQINLLEKNDYSFQLSQGFAAPRLYQRQKAFWQSKIDFSQKDLELQEKIVSNEIKSIFYQYLFVHKKINVWHEKEKMYEKLLKVATSRQQAGESSVLEKVSAETFLREAMQNKALLEREKEILENQVALRLGKLETILLDTQLVFKLPLPDTSSFSRENSFVSLWKEQKNIATQERQFSQAQRLPDFRVGYFLMSVEGKPIAQVFQAGLALPIFSKIYQKNIQAAKTKERLAQTQYDYQKQVQDNQRSILLKQLEQNLISLDFYEQTALKQADIILEKAQKTFQIGEIDYPTFIQTTEQAWKIRLAYWEALSNYNQIILQLEILK
jgi:cobalt-zinc-cadmium resistance protein CzcA